MRVHTDMNLQIPQQRQPHPHLLSVHTTLYSFLSAYFNVITVLHLNLQDFQILACTTYIQCLTWQCTTNFDVQQQECETCIHRLKFSSLLSKRLGSLTSLSFFTIMFQVSVSLGTALCPCPWPHLPLLGPTVTTKTSPSTNSQYTENKWGSCVCFKAVNSLTSWVIFTC